VGQHGHDAEHAHTGPAAPATRTVRLLLLLTLVPLVLGTVAGLVLLWPSKAPRASDVLGVAAHRERAAVVDVRREACLGGADSGGATCRIAFVRLTSGSGKGATVRVLLPEGAGVPQFRSGDKVVVAHNTKAPAGQRWQAVDYQRGRPLALLAAAFTLIVVALGRWRGLAALIGLAVSGFVLVVFILPAILVGENPLAVAVVGASATLLVVLFLAHGFSARTVVAVIGTTASLVLIGVLSYVTVEASRFSGLGSEEAAFLRTAYGNLDLRGLLLAGIIIGSLGVLDDVTVTQTSVAWEIAHANPALTGGEVYHASMRVGRDHVASTVNTLALAYAGASLPAVLLFTVSGAATSDVLTTEVVAQEVVRTLVGGIGIVAAVPVTTALATVFAVADRGRPRGGRRRATGRKPVAADR
jgi:uncharacterized membrane protein